MRAASCVAVHSGLLLLLLAVTTTKMTASAASASSCQNYTKGAFGPADVDDEPTCRTACETAEGLSTPDHNSVARGNVTYHKCMCKSTQTSTSNRVLCEDEGYASSGAFSTGAPFAGAGAATFFAGIIGTLFLALR